MILSDVRSIIRSAGLKATGGPVARAGLNHKKKGWRQPIRPRQIGEMPKNRWLAGTKTAKSRAIR
jgi:hypothetical protein